MHEWHGKSVLDVPMGVDTMRASGTMLGTCCVTVMAAGTCPVARDAEPDARSTTTSRAASAPPAGRVGAGSTRIVEQDPRRQGDSMDELDSLHEIANDIMGNTICAFGEGTAMPALGFLKKFRKDFEAYVLGERKRADARLVVR